MSATLIQSCIETGLRAHREGNIVAARDAYQSALKLAPDDANAQQLLGVALLQLGEPQQAVAYLEPAARKLTDNPGVHGNLAQAYFSLGLYEKSNAAFLRASRLDPSEMQYRLGCANSLALQGRLAEAENLLRRMSARYPANPYVWFNLGNALRDQLKAEAALDAYRNAVKYAPDFFDALNNMAGALHRLMRLQEAEQQYRAALELSPGHPVARCNLVSVLIDRGRFAEAEAECHEIIAAHPNLGLAHTFLGAALGHQGRLAEALACHRAAVTASPCEVKSVETYAGALADLGYFNDALRWFSRALSLQADSVPAHEMLGTTLLAQGCLQEGWDEYRYRPARRRLVEKDLDLKLTRSLPPDLGGKHVCIVREQGLGDEIFFLRFAPALHRAGASITYRASNKIGSLIKRVASIARVIEEMAPVPRCDAVIMAGDLPYALGAHPASAVPVVDATQIELEVPDVPRRISIYWPRVPPPLPLTALPDQIERVRARLEQAGKPPYLGITWQGGTPPGEQTGVSWVLYKEIGLEALAGAIDEFPGTFVALQRNPVSGRIDALSGAIGRPVHDFTDLNEDLEAMLALLSMIDEYVGVSNTNMHLRASAGKTARVLVPRPAEWRWMARGRHSPWFPDFTIYRQDNTGDWSAALAALKRDLAALWE